MQSFVEYLICKYFVLPQVINFDEVQFILSLLIVLLVSYLRTVCLMQVMEVFF